MGVIINEFEIVTEQAGETAVSSPTAAAPAPPPQPSAAPDPTDIVDVLRRHTDRMRRLRAH